MLVAASGDLLAQSQIRVGLTDGSPFTLSVNGRYFNRRGTSVTVGDLPPGRHDLKIYAIDYDQWGDPYQRTLFQGRVSTDYQMTTHVLLDPATRRARIRRAAGNNSGDSYQHYSESKQGAATEPAGGTVAAAPNVASPALAGSLNKDAQDALKNKIDALKTDTQKLKALKDGLQGQTISTFQAMTMMDWLLFETSRLDFAKWAYTITIDTDFYKDVLRKFADDANKKDFTSFLRSKGKY